MQIRWRIESVEIPVLAVSNLPYDAPVARKRRRHHLHPTSPESCIGENMKPTTRKLVHTKHNKINRTSREHTPPDTHSCKNGLCQDEFSAPCLWRVQELFLLLQGRSISIFPNASQPTRHHPAFTKTSASPQPLVQPGQEQASRYSRVQLICQFKRIPRITPAAAVFLTTG